jgi:hypothetical protein
VSVERLRAAPAENHGRARAAFHEAGYGSRRESRLLALRRSIDWRLRYKPQPLLREIYNLEKSIDDTTSWQQFLDTAREELQLSGKRKDVDFAGADLSGADLRAANLSRSVLKDATMVEPWYDSKTKWPKGFQAPEHNKNPPPEVRKPWDDLDQPDSDAGLADV